MSLGLFDDGSIFTLSKSIPIVRTSLQLVCQTFIRILTPTPNHFRAGPTAVNYEYPTGLSLPPWDSIDVWLDVSSLCPAYYCRRIFVDL